jgi:hypothetical protein
MERIGSAVVSCDQRLTKLAKREVNPDAVAAA